MKSWPSGSQSGAITNGSDGSRYLLCVRMFKSLFLFFALLCCGDAAFAQQLPGTQPGSTQNPGAVDCSDPLQAGSSQCASPNGRSLAFPFPNQQANTPNLGLSSEQPGGLPRTYSDAESQARQQAAQGRSQQIPLPPEPLT